ncbi:MAG: hypothetical protein KJ989_04930 [Gammaproteobacteria bacterium]|nr:hypothetical protein [Gammaproteobacteria bacterium]MBU2066399.1 hypothetical protein [Gammaproteobacteria bacterium]MBU2137256.1 hypothetical protein [Gammaproteobacteria bacterium]MBU2256978.1 hypothetical protein [Gammaproteobacteria bacterium]MBU2293531.1 hypothetical protein [Gammaproteobacteria bacterium]
MTTVHPSLLLRRTLLADGLVGVITTAQLLLLTNWLSSLLALPGEFLFSVGVVLIPLVAFLLWLSRRESMARAAVYTVIGLNALWVVLSLLALLSGWFTPNVLGYAFVIVQAVVVLAFIELEWLGLKRSQVGGGEFAPASMRAQ